MKPIEEPEEHIDLQSYTNQGRLDSKVKLSDIHQKATRFNGNSTLYTSTVDKQHKILDKKVSKKKFGPINVFNQTMMRSNYNNSTTTWQRPNFLFESEIPKKS